MLDALRLRVKAVMRGLAKVLNKLSGGKLSPNVITVTGLIMHVPIAYLIATDNLLWAAGLLVVFGLFDTLDGELARLQSRASNRGMFLDSVTDRVKEVLLYIGIGYLFVSVNEAFYAVWVVVAVGLSVTISYINAWGEVALSKQKAVTDHQQNKSFRSGLLSYDIRIFLILVGLVFNVLQPVVVLIAALSFVTVLQRVSLVLKKLA